MSERFQFNFTMINDTDFIDAMQYSIEESIRKRTEKRNRELMLEALQVEDIEFTEIKIEDEIININ